MKKIAFLLGSPEISGGTYVIFEHVKFIRSQGLEVYIVTENTFSKKSLDWYKDALEFNWLTLKEAKDIYFDLTIATWWKTVYWLSELSSKNFLYFVQSIESRFYSQKDILLLQKVDATYMAGMPMVTEAKWIQAYLAEKTGQTIYLAPNGIRKDLYCKDIKPIEAKKKDMLRVLVEGPVDVGFKNVKKSIELCRKSNADEVWLLTSSNIKSYPGVDRVFSQVPIEEVGMIYASCDVLVKLSYVEGMFGPPLEMFHCGGTAIVYDVTGHDEYIKHDKNAFVVKRDNEEDVIKYINLLKENSGKLQELQAQALQTAKGWPDWTDASSQFLTTIHDVLEQNSQHVLQIQKRITFMDEQYTKLQNLTMIQMFHFIKQGLKYHLKKILGKV